MGEKEGKKLDRDSQPVRLPGVTRKGVGKASASERSVLRSRLPKSRNVVRKNVETRGDVHKEFYDLGVADTDNVNVQSMRKLKPSILVGSVDSTRFAQKWHEAKWYNPFIDAAMQLSVNEDLLDPATKKWFKEVKPALDVFLKMGTYTGSDSSLKRKFHKDIWKLVKKNGSDIVYGKKGVLNFLLAFRRITNVYPKLDYLSAGQVKLVLGKGVGKKKGAKDRFAYMIVKKEKEVKVKVKVKPAPKPKPTPKVEKFGGKDFCEKYEINKPAEFKKDLAQFKEWITDKKMKYLQDEDFWKKKPGETDAQTDVRFNRLFADKRAGIHKLYVDLALVKLYEKWLAEANDDVSRKYKLLYFWVAKRMLEYTQKYEANPGILMDRLLNYHKNVMLTESLLKGKGDKTVLTQLIDSSKYLMENDYDEKEKAKWKKLNAKYKRDFFK